MSTKTHWGCLLETGLTIKHDCNITDQDEVGWKIIHADVFRFPPYKSWLCAILGMLLTLNHLMPLAVQLKACVPTMLTEVDPDDILFLKFR